MDHSSTASNPSNLISSTATIPKDHSSTEQNTFWSEETFECQNPALIFSEFLISTALSNALPSANNSLESNHFISNNTKTSNKSLNKSPNENELYYKKLEKMLIYLPRIKRLHQKALKERVSKRTKFLKNVQNVLTATKRYSIATLLKYEDVLKFHEVMV